MNRPMCEIRPNERGSILVLALSFSMVVGILIVGAVSTAMLQAKTMRANSDSLFAAGIAEGVSELAQKSMLVAVADFEDPPLSGTEVIGGQTVAWSAMQLGAPSDRTDIDGIQMTGTPTRSSCRRTSRPAPGTSSESSTSLSRHSSST